MIASQDRQPLLRADNLAKRFGGLTAVKDFSFVIMPGEVVGMIGPNGAGKTTCFNLLTGFYTLTVGRVLVNGPAIKGWKP